MSVVTYAFTLKQAMVLIPWAYEFAHCMGVELDILYSSWEDASGRPEKEHIAELVDRAREAHRTEWEERQQELEESKREPFESILLEVRKLPASVSAEDILNEIAKERGDLLLLYKDTSVAKGSRQSELTNELFDSASCRVVILRATTPPPLRFKKITVSCSEGPHTKSALTLAAAIAEKNYCILEAVHVRDHQDEIAYEMGKRFLTQLAKRSGIESEELIKPRVMFDQDVSRAIGIAAADESDMLFIGNSNAGAIRRTLYGTIPERVINEAESLSLCVIRAEKPIASRIKHAVERLLDLGVPQLDREARISLYERIEVGSRWNFDFLTLITLSTLIATLGLVQNSAAVVIGAMLVAPLMTPLLGVGLALVQANAYLLRTSVIAIILGFLGSVVVALIVGIIVEVQELTPELSARTGPSLIDLFIALASGIAAAHCIARPNLSAALPGVAIAAALIPPISTIGVALSSGHFLEATGAGLLFLTNILIITLSAALTFYAAGIRSSEEVSSSRRWASRLTLALISASVVLVIPLSHVLVRESKEMLQLPVIEEILQGYVARTSQIKHFSVRVQEKGHFVAFLESSTPLSEENLSELQASLHPQLEQGSTVEVRIALVNILQAKAE